MKRADVDTDEIKLAWKTLSDITCSIEPSAALPECNERAPEVTKKIPDFKLSYFKVFYGRAEAIRHLLTHAGADWEEHNVEFSDWHALKPTVPGN